MRRLGPEDFYVIALAVQAPTSTATYFDVLSHEVLHALYRLNPEYEAVVRRFWRNQLSPHEQVAFILSLGDAYALDMPDVILDEFQAYILQLNSEAGGYGQLRNYANIDFVRRFKRPLLRRLKRAGINFIDIR